MSILSLHLLLCLHDSDYSLGSHQDKNLNFSVYHICCAASLSYSSFLTRGHTIYHVFAITYKMFLCICPQLGCSIWHCIMSHDENNDKGDEEVPSSWMPCILHDTAEHYLHSIWVSTWKSPDFKTITKHSEGIDLDCFDCFKRQHLAPLVSD